MTIGPETVVSASEPPNAGGVSPALMESTISSVLKSADSIGNFWTKWGVSGSLFLIGTFAIIVAFAAHSVDSSLWDDSSFFGALAFGLAILILGFVAFADKQNRAAQTGEQAVDIYRITVDASLQGQRIAADERKNARPEPSPSPVPGSGING